MIVLHHNKDLDGFSSGAICKLRFPEAKLIGWDYKDPIPDFDQFKGEDVIMIDISFPMNYMLELLLKAHSLTWIDHHISAKKEYDAYTNDLKYEINYFYEPSIAACEIGWKTLFPEKPIPYSIKLLGRYDTWRKDEGDWEGETLPFQYAMRTYCTSPETFRTSLFSDDNGMIEIDDLVDRGAAILKYQEQQDMLACKRSAFSALVGGRPAICLNTRAFSSETMKSVYDPELHDLMVGFEYTGTKWSVSLRSDKPGIDVSIIAKSKGGGGHKQAAGFEVKNFSDIFL